MRKWKDNPPQMVELTKATIIFLSATNAFVILAILFTGDISPMQIIGLITSGLMIYLMYTGKFYSMLRWYAERQLKKRDNKWR